MMTRRQKLFVALASCHLLLVAYSSLSLPLAAWGNPVGDPLRWYGSISGANNSYGFFKQVGCCFQVTFVMTDGDKVWTDTLSRGFGKEADLRLNSGVNLLPDFGDSVVQNWAATMMGRHPSAQQVYVKIEKYDPGTMADYRAGIIPQWEIIPYSKGFDRHGRPAPSPEELP